MRIRRFSGPAMADVLRQVKAAIGPDAVILETQEAAGQVTVSVAVDDAPEVRRPRAPLPRPREAELAGEVRELLGVVRALVGAHGRETAAAHGPELAGLHRALVAQGVDGAIAAILVRETAARLDAGTPLAGALAATLAAATGAPPATRVRLFVGPPGDGKTTTVAKLAAAGRRAGQSVALVTTDTYRVGGVPELEAYGRVLGVPVHVAPDAAALARALAATAAADRVLVDTAGAAPGQAGELAELAALVDAAGADAGRTLVASATAGPAAARGVWDAFAPLGPDACVLTKLDAAPVAAMLGVVWRGGVPVTHVAAGRRIPFDLEPATADRLARALLAA
jgi:flagellar biosynthesis protein FlhF